MRRILPLVLVLLSAAGAARAAGFEGGIRHLVSIPMGSQESAAGTLEVPLSRGFSATGEVFWSERFSTQLAAGFLNPEAILYPASGDPHDVDLGTLGLDVYSLTARWHFAPHGRWSLFAGAGPALVVFGDLEDRFGDDLEATVGSEVTVMAEGGLRYQFRPRLSFELSASWMPLEGAVDVQRDDDPRVTIPETVVLDPVIVSIGANWRF